MSPSDLPPGYVNVSRNQRGHPKCPKCNSLVFNVLQRLGTRGHVVLQNPFLACARVRTCVRARTHIHTYIVSVVSTCPNPFCYGVCGPGQVRDTWTHLSPLRKEGLR